MGMHNVWTHAPEHVVEPYNGFNILEGPDGVHQRVQLHDINLPLKLPMQCRMMLVSMNEGDTPTAFRLVKTGGDRIFFRSRLEKPCDDMDHMHDQHLP